MKAMVLVKTCRLAENPNPLELTDLPTPVPEQGEVLVKVSVCGICHTELDEIEGRTPPPRLPVVPGHQIVGTIEETGAESERFQKGDRVGIAWIHSACGDCRQCDVGEENLCASFAATGRDVDGGYAEYTKVREDFAFRIPEGLSDAEVAPLLCAGAIGYRSLKLTGLQNGQSLGLTGFGASGHIILALSEFLYPDSEIFVFARSEREREFAMELGAEWAGDTEEKAPRKLDCIIDTTPVWKPVVEALANLEPGGRLVINAIRKEAADKDYLLNLDYPKHLWLEKEIKSVANVARDDVSELLELAAAIPLKPTVQVFAMEDANTALVELKNGNIRGAKVIRIG